MIDATLRGNSGLAPEVKDNAALATAADKALVVQHRPDDPLLTALVNDTVITGQGGQLALNQNILLASAGAGPLDVIGARSIAMEIVPAAGTVTAGAITFEGSNDNANWVPMLMYDKAAMANAPVSSYTLAASTPRYFLGNVFFRYFRARISTGITGTTTGVQAFSALLSNDLSFAIQHMRITDGTNLMPTMDAAARAGNQKVTDGTNTAAVKAASTAAAAADPALAVTLSPNLPVPTVHTLEAAATTNATSVKATAGRITALVLSNVSAAAKYFKLFQKASAPTVGTDIPVATIAIPASSVVVVAVSDLGLYVGTGIAYAITGAIANADATAVAAGDVKVLMNYI